MEAFGRCVIGLEYRKNRQKELICSLYYFTRVKKIVKGIASRVVPLKH